MICLVCENLINIDQSHDVVNSISSYELWFCTEECLVIPVAQGAQEQIFVGIKRCNLVGLVEYNVLEGENGR